MASRKSGGRELEGVGADSRITAVGFGDCKRELLDRAKGRALEEYRRWRRQPGYGEVVDFVETFEHKYLFETTMSEISAVKRRSEHALGDVEKEEQLPEVENFTCPFAFQHLFPFYIEEKRSLPTWQEFSTWLQGPVTELYTDHLLNRTGWHEADKKRRLRLKRAYRWRLGIAYYSALREVELLTRWRDEYSLPVRYHLLADVLLRVDFWLGDALVCTYFPNKKYRSGTRGRKLQAARLFSAAEPPFKILDIEVPRQGRGNLWSLNKEAVQRSAQYLRDAQARSDT